jgi:hypothetical protein
MPKIGTFGPLRNFSMLLELACLEARHSRKQSNFWLLRNVTGRAESS